MKKYKIGELGSVFTGNTQVKEIMNFMNQMILCL